MIKKNKIKLKYILYFNLLHMLKQEIFKKLL